jgi:hypothetical protein
MKESAIRNAAASGGLGLTAACWAVNQTFPDAPWWLIALVAAASVLLLVLSSYFWLLGTPKPKKKIIDALTNATIKGDELAKEVVDEIIDEVLYHLKVKAWIDEVGDLLDRETGVEQAFMFKTLPPTLGNSEDEQTCRAAITARVSKLRLITARYISGKNVED